MMKFKPFDLLLASATAVAAAFLLSACQSKVAEHNALIDPNAVREIANVPISTIVEELKFIPLETSDSCLVGRISTIKRRNGMFYFISGDRLMQFGPNGEYIRTVVKKGPGPEDVTEIHDFDASDKGVIIASPGRLTLFTPEGAVKKTITHDFGYGRVRLTDDGWLMVLNHPVEASGNRLLVFDNNGDTIKSLLKTPDFDECHFPDLTQLDKGCYMHQVGLGNELIVYDVIHDQEHSMRIVDSDDVMTAEEFVNFSGRRLDVPKPLVSSPITTADKFFVASIENRQPLVYIGKKKRWLST